MILIIDPSLLRRVSEGMTKSFNRRDSSGITQYRQKIVTDHPTSVTENGHKEGVTPVIDML